MMASRYEAEIAPLPLAATFEARGPEDRLALAASAAGLPWPERLHRIARDASGVGVARLGPTRILIRADIAREAELERRLTEAFSAVSDADFALLSDTYAGFLVSGPGAVDILRQGAPFDIGGASFSPGSATGTELWGVTVVVMRPADPPHGFAVLVDNSFAGYIGNWLAAASGAEPIERPGVMTNPPRPLKA